MATQTGVITINGIKIIECDISPITGIGLSAPIGSIASAKDGSGLFYKQGLIDTAWNYSGASPINGVYNSYNIDTSVTGVVSETVLTNLKVNGGDMGSNGVLWIESEFAKLGIASGGTVKCYISSVGTNSIGNTGVPTSSTLIATQIILTASLCPQRFSRKIVNKNSPSSNYIFTNNQSATNIYSGTSNTNRTLLNTNTDVDFWIVITVTLTNPADTYTVQNCQLYINKP